MNFEWERVIGWTLGAFLFLSGCVGTRHPRISLAEKGPVRVCRVVLLPFKNQTKSTAAGLMLYRVLMAEMARMGNFSVVEEGMIRRILLRGKVYPGQPLTPETREAIVRAIRPDALLSGKVVTAVETTDEVRLAFTLRMQEARTGRLLWTTYYARNGEDYRRIMHFGEIDTLSGLARQMVLDVLKIWYEEKLGGCSR